MNVFTPPDKRVPEEVDPFVKRVVTVHPEDRVIFRVLIPCDPEEFAEIKAKLQEKMGSIPIVVIGLDIDITVLKPPKGPAQSEVLVA